MSRVVQRACHTLAFENAARSCARLDAVVLTWTCSRSGRREAAPASPEATFSRGPSITRPVANVNHRAVRDPDGADHDIGTGRRARRVVGAAKVGLDELHCFAEGGWAVLLCDPNRIAARDEQRRERPPDCTEPGDHHTQRHGVRESRPSKGSSATREVRVGVAVGWHEGRAAIATRDVAGSSPRVAPTGLRVYSLHKSRAPRPGSRRSGDSSGGLTCRCRGRCGPSCRSPCESRGTSCPPWCCAHRSPDTRGPVWRGRGRSCSGSLRRCRPRSAGP